MIYRFICSTSQKATAFTYRHCQQYKQAIFLSYADRRQLLPQCKPHLLFPDEPEFEDIVEPATLKALVSSVIRDVVTDLVLLEQVGGVAAVALTEQVLMLREEC